MAFGNWISLAYDDEEMEDNSIPSMPEKPEYPYCMRFALTGRELEMMGLPLPKRGELLHVQMMAEVTNVSDGDGGQRVELIPQMVRLENEDDDDE